MNENEVAGTLIGVGIALCYLLLLRLVRIAGQKDAQALNAFAAEHGREADEDDDIDWKGVA